VARAGLTLSFWSLGVNLCFPRNVVRGGPPKTCAGVRQCATFLTTDFWSAGVGVDRGSIEARQCCRQQPGCSRASRRNNVISHWSLLWHFVTPGPLMCLTCLLYSFRVPYREGPCLQRVPSAQIDLASVFSRHFGTFVCCSRGARTKVKIHNFFAQNQFLT